MVLMREVPFILDIRPPNPEVFCKVFEYSQSCIAVAKSNTFSPIIEHTSVKYHCLQSFIQKKIIQICYIDTQEQTAEIFTKTLYEALYIYLRSKLSGW